MIDLYYWPTPNGWKVSILLEECGAEYRVIPIDINKGAQSTPEFRRINPNGRIPAIVDLSPLGSSEPISVFESGAILQYVAEKHGRFLPSALGARYNVMQWVWWQVGGLGPMAGQLSHFINYAPETMEYPLQRYRSEYLRLLGVLNTQLDAHEYIAGDYSIADMAAWPWLVPYKRFGIDLEQFSNLKRWHTAIKSREAVRRGMDVGKAQRTFQRPDDEARRNLFGAEAGKQTTHKGTT